MMNREVGERVKNFYQQRCVYEPRIVWSDEVIDQSDYFVLDQRQDRAGTPLLSLTVDLIERLIVKYVDSTPTKFDIDELKFFDMLGFTIPEYIEEKLHQKVEDWIYDE